MKPICPGCHSKNVKVIKDNSLTFIQCKACGYDELAGDEVFPEQRTSQREKGRFSPYKAGGKGRVRKSQE